MEYKSEHNNDFGPPEKISAVIIALVIVAVLIGFIRLAIAHWEYVILVIITVFAGYYLLRPSKK